jgi:hypothetical protein
MKPQISPTGRVLEPHRCKTVLSAIFTTALNDHIIYFHPCTGVTTPTIPKRPLRILTPEEFDRILHALQAARWQLFAELALETGLRWGELTELRARDLHIPTRTLTVARSVVELHTPHPAESGTSSSTTPKTPNTGSCASPKTSPSSSPPTSTSTTSAATTSSSATPPPPTPTRTLTPLT